MFWSKTKKVKEKQSCNANKDLNECSIVSNLRKYQQELKEIEAINLGDITKKYFKIESGEHWSHTVGVDFLIERLVRCGGETNFEEWFRNFGKEIDKYINSENLIKEFNYKIKYEKEKLGIQ